MLICDERANISEDTFESNIEENYGQEIGSFLFKMQLFIKNVNKLEELINTSNTLVIVDSKLKKDFVSILDPSR